MAALANDSGLLSDTLPPLPLSAPPQSGFTSGIAALSSRYLTSSNVAAAVAVFLLGSFLLDCALKPRYPKTLPRVGYGDSVVATLRNWLGYVLYFDKWVKEGYHKYAKHGRAFVVPSAASRPMELVVPRSQTAWFMDLPDHILSAHAAHNDVLYDAYNFFTPIEHHGPATPGHHHDSELHTRVVHRNLARRLPALIPAIEAEVADAVPRAFAAVKDDGEWHSVTLWDVWLSIVPQVTNRLLIGNELCRDQDLMQHYVRFADTVVLNSFVLNVFPRMAHPIVGGLLRIRNYRQWQAAHAILAPMLVRRLATVDAANKESLANLPEDYVTWIIRTAAAEGKTEELTPDAISKRLLPIEFAAIHTTVMTGHFVMLDLLSSDPALGYLDAIRQEAEALHPSANSGTASTATGWDKAALARMWRTDSAIRESMRVSHFATSLVKRKVVAAEGLTNTAEKWHVPYGGLMMLDLANVHHDPELYADPDRYDAFRFARVREKEAAEEAAAAVPAAGAKSKEDGARAKTTHSQARKLGMVTTSDKHLAFGHGRHACPGRFFVAHELKMILAYMTTHYDFKPLESRPQSTWIGQTIIPPIDVKIQVRRRKVLDVAKTNEE